MGQASVECEKTPGRRDLESGVGEEEYKNRDLGLA